jgi:ubiquitin-protein ligase
MALFEQEAFLMYNQRRRAPRWRGAIDEATIAGLAATVVFDTKAENAVIGTATSKLPLSTPRVIVYQNQKVEIPDPRRRRILRELHAAAAIQDPMALAKDEEDKPVSLYDPDIRIYPFRGRLDQWRVLMRGLEETPYAGKWWYLYVTFPDGYPICPPTFQFVSVPFHMNVSADGRVCLNIIEKGYMASAPVVELLQNIKQLFLFPDLDTPIQLAKLDLYKTNQLEYDRLARESTERFAKNTPEEWLEGIPIDQDVPEDFSIVVSERKVPAYMKSQISGKFIPKDRQVLASSGVLYDRDELRKLLQSSGHPTCVITGRPLTDDLDEILV